MNTCVIAGSVGVVGSLPVGAVCSALPAAGALTTMIVCGALAASVGSAAACGGGVAVAGAGGGSFEDEDAPLDGDIATTIGARAPLCPTGLTAAPTITPNASSAITATAAAVGGSISTSPNGPARLLSSRSVPASPSCAPASGSVAVPVVVRRISSATASGSGPRRVPHSTQ